MPWAKWTTKRSHRTTISRSTMYQLEPSVNNFPASTTKNGSRYLTANFKTTNKYSGLRVKTGSGLMWMQIQAHSAKSFSHHLNLSCNACKASSIGILLAWGPACAVNAQQCGKWSHEDGVNRVHERLQPGH